MSEVHLYHPLPPPSILYQQFRQFLTSETDQALVIHGESGVGKTSFMAKAASMVNSLLPMQAFVIPR